MSKPFAKNKVERILIVAITRLGDMLQGSPTIIGLKQANPDAKVTVLIDRAFASVCDGIPGIDEVYVIDLSFVVRCVHMEGEGIVEAYDYVDKLVEDLRQRRFDFVLNMSSSPYTALLCRMLDAPETRGWMSDEEGFRIISSPWAMLFAAFVFHSNRDYNDLNLVDIFRCAAKVKDHPHTLRYEPSPDDHRFAEELLDSEVLPGDGPLIMIQAGASQEKRQWAPVQFARLAERLISTLGARLVFVGTDGERRIVDEIFRLYSHPRMTSILGKTSVGQLGAVLSRADLLVTGDTGPMHLAVAVGTPVVALFLASALGYETGPYSPGNFIIQPQIGCNPCNPNYPCARPDCHDQITPELVAELVSIRLSHPREDDDSLALPSHLVRQQRAAIYVTAMDGDGFLECRLMGGAAPRRGEPVEFFECARKSYRALWKEEFDGIVFRPCPPTGGLPAIAHPRLAAVREIVALADEAIIQLNRLREAVIDTRTPGHVLGALNGAVSAADRAIEEVGLSEGLLGAIVRIFLMEKENIRGDDVLELVGATLQIHTTLIRRVKRFAELFGFYANHLQAVPSPRAKLPVMRSEAAAMW